MEEVTLALAILLGVGFVAAKLGQLLRLPSVTGYICAGLLLGPSGLNVVTADAMGERLDHFTQIALMLIAFGIGEHLELKRLRYLAREVLLVGSGEILGSFCLVSCGMFLMIYGTSFVSNGWDLQQAISISLLMGAISIATAPATVLSVLREIRATGPVTSTLLPVVAVNNGIAIIMFGVVLSVARQMSGGLQGGALLTAFGRSLMEICFSLFMGVATGILIDLIVNRLRHRGEMLTFGLAALLLCGELARHFGLSPLLAGMAAGFSIVNRDHRDVRLFRALNAFEAPVYVLFFTLAGAQLHLEKLVVAGWVGLFYFCLRGLGKISGANFGGRLADAVISVRYYLGWALLPQAGVAIGLVLFIQSFPELHALSEIITPVVLAGVLLAELIGPLSVRIALEKAGESVTNQVSRTAVGLWHGNMLEPFEEEVKIAPWTWEKLFPPHVQQGAVLFGTAHVQTVVGLARMATLLSHYHHARPLAVRVMLPENNDDSGIVDNADQTLFETERNEVENLGYELDTALVQSYDVASAIVSTARWNDTRCILLGYPHSGTAQEFEDVVEQVARESSSQVIVAHFNRALHTERILVPLISRKDLPVVHNVVCALAGVGRHKVTLMRLLSQDASEMECRSAEKNLHQWAVLEDLVPYVTCGSFATEARLETILKAAEQHDLIIMASSNPKGLHRLFFGSLADEVAKNCKSSMLMVHGSGK